MKVKVKRKTKKDEYEISPDELCFCGSGRSYGDCCQTKKIQYSRRNGKPIKTIPMDDNLREILEEEKRQFEEYYNRSPGKNDYVVAFAPSYNNEILIQLVYTMRRCGIPEERIYAFYKTDGLIPSDFNIDYIPDTELQEYKEYYDEYIRLMSEVPKATTMNSLQFVMQSNTFIAEKIDYISQALTSTCNDFIHRHTQPNEVLCFATKDPLDFCIFSILKTVKTLSSIETLYNNHIPECIYSLGRSIFENYMYMCAINTDPDFFKTKLLPLIDDENYLLFIEPNGRISNKKAIEKATGKEHNTKVIVAQLKNYFKYTSDNILYDEFYSDACQYVHVDILSAKQYYSAIDIYNQIDPTLIAAISVLAIAVILLNELCECTLVNKQYARDFNNLFVKLRDKLIQCLSIINSDPLHKAALTETLIKRLEEV